VGVKRQPDLVILQEVLIEQFLQIMAEARDLYGLWSNRHRFAVQWNGHIISPCGQGLITDRVPNRTLRR